MEKINNLQQPRRMEFSTRPPSDSMPMATAEMTKASIYSKSWRENVVTKDFESFLGGYIWPPRSYSCSFCKREFSSAQALGGHMNIHRKDRARFKQEEEEVHQDKVLCKKCITYDTDQNPNPNSYSYDHNFSSSLTNDSSANQYCVPLRLKRCFNEEVNEKTWNSKRRKDFICCYVKSFNLSEALKLQVFEPQVTDLSPIHVGELDLELRIGRSSA